MYPPAFLSWYMSTQKANQEIKSCPQEMWNQITSSIHHHRRTEYNLISILPRGRSIDEELDAPVSTRDEKRVEKMNYTFVPFEGQIQLRSDGLPSFLLEPRIQ